MGTEPFLMQLLSVKIDCPNKSECIIATTENTTGRTIRTIQMSHGSQETFSTITITAIVGTTTTVIPIEGTISFTSISGVAVWIIEDGMNRLTRFSLEYGKPFLSTRDASIVGTIKSRTRYSLDNRICGHTIDVYSLSIKRAWTCLTHHLCSSITIKVIDHKLCIVSSSSDVAS